MTNNSTNDINGSVNNNSRISEESAPTQHIESNESAQSRNESRNSVLGSEESNITEESSNTTVVGTETSAASEDKSTPVQRFQRECASSISDQPVLLSSSFSNGIRGNIVKLSCKYDHGLLLTDEGHVYSFGSRTCGKLGTGHADKTKARSLADPEVFPVSCNDKRVKDIAVGADHSLAVTVDGEVYSWGSSEFGQLGQATLVPQFEPKVMESVKDRDLFIVGVAAGDHHSIILNAKGEAFSCGKGEEGQLGVSDHEIHSIPMFVKGLFRTKIKKVAAGPLFSAFLTVDGEVFMSGDGTCGQLGQGNTRSYSAPILIKETQSIKIVDVQCGWGHTLLLADDGSVYSCGLNEKGQCGVGDRKARRTITRVQFQPQPDSRSTSNNRHTKSPASTKIPKVKQIACGHFFSVANTDYGVFVWGRFNGRDLLEPTLLEFFTYIQGQVTNVFCGKQKMFVVVSSK